LFLRAPAVGLDGTWGTEDDDYGDLQVDGSSPAIDAGDNDALPLDISTDLSGEPRFVDIPSMPDTGNGTPPIVDLGAYEFTNEPPLAVDDLYTTTEDTTLTIAAPGVLENDSDPDGEPLTAVEESGPAIGTLGLEPDGSLVYKPDDDAHGVVTFTYHAHDGLAGSNTATVTITVSAVNDPPTISDVPDQSTCPGAVVGPVPFTVGDVETAAEALSLSAASSNTALVPVEGVLLGGSSADRSVTITPTAGLTGTAILTITVHDGTDSGADSFRLTVEPFCLYLPLAVREG
jgi:VCBS repeat-containing protein